MLKYKFQRKKGEEGEKEKRRRQEGSTNTLVKDCEKPGLKWPEILPIPKKQVAEVTSGERNMNYHLLLFFCVLYRVYNCLSKNSYNNALPDYKVTYMILELHLIQV